MRSFLVIATALTSFLVLLTFATTDANAVVCARGVARAGCVASRGAVIVHTAPVCHYVIVNGVRVRRCV